MEKILVPIFELNDGSSKRTLADVKKELMKSGVLQKVSEEHRKEGQKMLEKMWHLEK